jgi:Gnt-I system high-affinity gluconate transporter
MAMRAVAEMVLPKGHAFLGVAEFLGDPVMATLIAVLIALFTFGLNRGRNMDQINETLGSSIKIIAMMLLIIGGGGAFKQVAWQRRVWRWRRTPRVWAGKQRK